MGSVGGELTALSLSSDQAALTTCSSTDFGCSATVCCISSTLLFADSFLYGPLEVASATA